MIQHAEDLTRRESDVIAMLLGGLGVAGTAEELGISHHTVRTHVKRAHGKTNTVRLDQIVAWAHHHESCCVRARKYLA